MPLAECRISRDRFDFHGSLTTSEVESLVSDRDLRVLQTKEAADPRTWDLLNSCFFPLRPDVELRVYGHYGESCNLAFLSQLGNVRRFAADCLLKATGVHSINSLVNLQSLSIGIYDLESFDFLNGLQTDRLTDLSLGATFSKKPNLRVIERFARLERLYIEGQPKDIEVIGSLSFLQKLTLRSVTLPSLAFLRGLVKLWSLEIKLGGTKNLEALGHLENIKYLELWQIKGLSNLTPIADMTKLQFLSLQALRNVEQLPDLSRLLALRRVYLENMKGLHDLTALTTAPVLEELVHVSAQGGQPSQYVGLLGKGSLKRMLVGFGSDRKNEELRTLMRAAGVKDYHHSPFCFA